MSINATGPLRKPETIKPAEVAKDTATTPAVAKDTPKSADNTGDTNNVNTGNQPQPSKLTAEAARQQSEQIKRDLATAKTPEDLKAIATRSDALRREAERSDDPAVKGQAAAIATQNDQIHKAQAAITRINDASQAINSGKPTDQAAAIASALGRPQNLAGAIADLGPLANSPLGQGLKAQTDAITKKATPEALAAQLNQEPDLSKYPPGMADSLLAMRALRNPALTQAMDKVGNKLLADSANSDGYLWNSTNPLSYDAVKQNPALMRLAAQTAEASPGDSEARKNFDESLQMYGKEALEKRLKGAKGEKETEAALEAFKADMMDLAKNGVPPEKVAELTASTLTNNQDAIVDAANGDKSFWQRAVDWVKDKVGALIDGVKNTVGGIAQEAAKAFYDGVIDPALDNAIGPDDPKFKGEMDGILDDVLTSRIQPGETLSLAVDGNAQLGPVKLGAGAKVEITRVQKTDANGNPLPPINGVPQTELKVKLIANANVGAGLTKEFGANATGDTTVAGQETKAGVTAGGKAEAEVNLKGEAALTFTFDPAKPGDMQALNGILGATAKTALAASVPGVGPLLAARTAVDNKEAFAEFGKRLTSVEGSVAVSGALGVEADMSGGIGLEDHDNSKTYVTGQKPETEKPAEQSETADSLKDKLIKAGAGKLIEQGKIDLGALSAGLKGEVKVSYKYDVKTGEQTLSITAAGSMKGQVSMDDATLGGEKGFDRTVALTWNKDGSIKGATVTDRMSKEKFAGLGETDIMGRVNSDVLAQVSETDTVSVTRPLKDPSAFKDNPASAFWNTMTGGNQDNMGPPTIKAVHTDSVSIGDDLGVVSVKLTASKAQERDLTAH